MLLVLEDFFSSGKLGRAGMYWKARSMLSWGRRILAHTELDLTAIHVF